MKGLANLFSQKRRHEWDDGTKMQRKDLILFWVPMIAFVAFLSVALHACSVPLYIPT